MSEGRAQASVSRLDPRLAGESHLYTRMNNLIRVGKVTKLDYNAGKAQVTLSGEPSEENVTTSHWLPWCVPEASTNRTWRPLEEGEQVIVFCPYGNINAGIIGGSINYSRFPHEASDGKRTLEVFGSKAQGFREVNRADWVVREYLNEAGTFRFEVGPPQSIVAGSSIIMDATHIQLRVGATQLVISDGAIRIQVDGQASEVALTGSSLVAHVANDAVLQMTAEAISAELVSKQVRALLSENSLKLMVKQVLAEITDEQAALSVLQSKITLSPDEIEIVSPSVAVKTVAAVPSQYIGGAAAEIVLHETLPPPELAVGYSPTTPSAP